MRKLAFVFALLILAISVNTALGLPGSGTQEDPWRIESLADFNEFAADSNYWDDWTRLETDVNLAGQTHYTAVIAPDTDNSNWYFDGTAFTGVFDGNDHKITALTIDDGGTGNDYLGLFGKNGGEVRNLGLEGGSVKGTGGWYVGGLVGGNGGSVSNCYSTGSVSGNWEVGGLVGRHSGIVSNCYSTADVSGDDYVGGLVGGNGGSVSNCYSTGSVSGNDYVGGLMGFNWYGSVSNCYSAGDVSGTGSYVGGLVGENRGSISNCYSTGDVNGTGYYVGGLVGLNYKTGSVSNCFWDTQTSGMDYSDGGTGKTTAEMQDANTFIDAGWDFTTPIWKFCSVPNYPSLWWEECPGPAELILDLADDVMALNLHKGITNSLEAKLNAALGALEDENENNDAAAVNTLEAFINAVEAQRGKKIPEAEADVLIAAAQEIIELLSDG